MSHGSFEGSHYACLVQTLEDGEQVRGSPCMDKAEQQKLPPRML